MKIDVSQIIKDHLSTLRDARSKGISTWDLIIFYVTPALIGALAYYLGFAATKDIYNVSITFFGIFAALLLNLQLAAFGIFQRKWEAPSDQKMADMQESTLKIRRVLLKEINSNISYLILVSSVAIVIFLLLFAMDWKSALPSALAVCLYWHFILTLLMIVKRSHALFQQEYKSDI